MTPLQKRSAASKKAFRSRKRRALARQTIERSVGRKGAAKRIMDATTPEKSSGVLAAELGVSPGYVRAVWRRAGLEKRRAGYRPAASLRGGAGA